MPWAPVQSARKGMGPSHGSHVDGTHLPSKLMESIQLTLALPSGRGACRFFNKCGKVPVSKEKRFVTKVAEIPSKLLWFGKN